MSIQLVSVMVAQGIKAKGDDHVILNPIGRLIAPARLRGKDAIFEAAPMVLLALIWGTESGVLTMDIRATLAGGKVIKMQETHPLMPPLPVMFRYNLKLGLRQQDVGPLRVEFSTGDRVLGTFVLPVHWDDEFS